MIQRSRRIANLRFLKELPLKYGLDERSLALFRVFLGVVLLIDFVRRYQHASTMYSDGGIFSRAYALETLNPYRWSLLFINGSESFVNIFLFAGIGLSIALILGAKTRWVTVLLWIALLSVQYRNTHLQNGADTLIRVSMFWAMFLPLGRCWSVDAYYSPTRAEHSVTRNGRLIVSVATFALLFQNALMYGITASLKSGPRWQEEGSALYYALGTRQVTTSLGDFVFSHAPAMVLTLMTFGTLIVEFALPILILLPYKTHLLRTAAVLAILSLHMGILFTMTVGYFPVISIAVGIAALPTWFWDTLVARIADKARNTGVYEKLSAIPQVLPNLPILPNPTHSHAHVAKSGDSQLFGIIHRPAIEPRQLPQMIGNIICSIALVMVVMWNIQSVSAYRAPEPVRHAVISTGLYQSWSMFAPGPPSSSSWTLVVGDLESGERVELLIPLVEDDMSLREPVTWDQSDSVLVQDKYWRKFFQSAKREEKNLRQFAAFTCRSWNAENSGNQRLSKIWLVQGYSKTLDDGQRAKPVFDQLGSWKCG